MLEAIIVFYLLWKLVLDIATDFTAELAMAVADAEKMETWKASEVWSEDVLVLVHLVGVVWVVANSGGEGELADAVFSFSVVRLGCLFSRFSRSVQWRGSTRWVLRLCELLGDNNSFCFQLFSDFLSLGRIRCALSWILISWLLSIWLVRYAVRMLVEFPSALGWLASHFPLSLIRLEVF